MKENWLYIKTPDDYGNSEIIQIEEDIIQYFVVEKNDEICLINSEYRNEKLSETEHKFINFIARKSIQLKIVYSKMITKNL